MAEILHHLGCLKPCKYWDIYYINWWSPDFSHQQVVQGKKATKNLTPPGCFPKVEVFLNLKTPWMMRPRPRWKTPARPSGSSYLVTGCHGDRFRPLSRALVPLPNGYSWFCKGGVTNYLCTKWDDPPSKQHQFLCGIISLSTGRQYDLQNCGISGCLEGNSPKKSNKKFGNH